MKKIHLVMVAVAIAAIAPATLVLALLEKQTPTSNEAVMAEYQAGNYKKAYEGFRYLLLEADRDSGRGAGDERVQQIHLGVQCLHQLGRLPELDGFLEATVDRHGDNWRVLDAAARLYLHSQHHGQMVSGTFERGSRNRGEYTNSTERDRVRALQLFWNASRLIEEGDDRVGAADFYFVFGAALQQSRHAWQLQELTDLSKLPDYEKGWYQWSPQLGAPVDGEGNPVYFQTPVAFDEAANDGERWRWTLSQASEHDSSALFRAQLALAAFMQSLVGVETLQQQYSYFTRPLDQEGESKIRAIHTLSDDETIARLATGIQEFRPRVEFNPIRIYQSVARNSSKDNERQQALAALATIFQNRRQYSRAAEHWQKAHEIEPRYQHQIDQIRKNWGRFDHGGTHVAGSGAVVEYRYRNGKGVTFVAHAIKVEQLLTDVIEHIESRPKRLDWRKVNIADVGYRLVTENDQRYRGKQVAEWSLELKPYDHHFDRRVSVTTPLQKSGAYLLTARMDDGNESHIVLWIDDSVIVSKALRNETLYYVGDAETGEPVAGANVEFFGYRQQHKDKGVYDIFTRRFAEHTSDDGILYMDKGQQENRYNWLAIARTDSGRFAYHGFNGVWYRNYHDQQAERERAYLITDRPVYRPGQTVHFKCWKRHSLYSDDQKHQYGGQRVTLTITSPRQEKSLEQEFICDDYGGFHGELELPEDAVLGQYRINVPRGHLTFRVEEYKKPEFEVTVEAPEKPVKLGEKFSATVRARYYFGEPVTDARVHYKVTRTTVSTITYPLGKWDWLYGNGYWWSSYDYLWYPGWGDWGCRRPTPWWWSSSWDPPEVVAEGDVKIGADGTVLIPIDTAIAKALHGDSDHRYQFTAEVVDSSRRTIVGGGSVLAAKQSMRVFTWLDRGFLRTGDTARAHFHARSADGKPVATRGQARLIKIDYDDEGGAEETVLEEWAVITDSDGRGTLQITAAQSGQYRLSVTLEEPDVATRTVEGAHIFSVIGTDRGGDFRFNDIELALDRIEYEPGDTAEMLVSTERKNSTVLLFLRPVNGVYLRPKTLRLTGHSRLETTKITSKDMPNFFVEVVTVSNGRVHTEARQVIVPPEKRVIDIAVKPTDVEVLPGASTSVQLSLTDHSGEPFVGSTVVSVYDRALEYISGGGNVSEIRSFFWSWKRHHTPRASTSAAHSSYNLFNKGDTPMNDIGLFGRADAPESVSFGASGGAGGDIEKLGAPKKKSRARGAPTADLSTDASAESFEEDAGNGRREQRQWGQDGKESGGDTLVEATVRKEFADSALWVASVTTDSKGQVTLPVKMPDNLTTWTVKAWAMGTRTEVGQGQAAIITRKNLMLRMQAPRFFTQKDQCVLSANVHNYLEEAKRVQVSLELDGPTLRAIDELSTWVDVPARGETRVDWRVEVMEPGEAMVRMKGLTNEESDAVEMKFPVHVHGARRTESIAGSISGSDTSSSFRFEVPDARRVPDTLLEVRYTPSVAGALVDAVPYLIAYPHGCTEQTLNRFLPAVVAQKTLRELGFDLKSIKDKRTNLNSLEIGDAKTRAAQWKRFQDNPVFDEGELAKVVKTGVERLTSMQLSDGGWGWFSGWGEHSSAHTTATVMRGLLVARENDVAIVPSTLDRGVGWLRRYQDEQLRRLRNAPTRTSPFKTHADNLDAFVFMVLSEADFVDQDMLRFLDRDRTKISVYAKAMFGLALEKIGDQQKLDRVLENLSQYIVVDEENETAFLKLPESGWWYWYRSEYEAHAYTLALFTRTDPKSDRTAALAKYLINNRKHASYWRSTRDTALCIESLAAYLKASGEGDPDMTVEVWINGEKHKEQTITRSNLFTFDNKVTIAGDSVASGTSTIELRRTGRGRLYYNANLTVFSLEDSIERAGLDLRVNRRYYRMTEVDDRASVPGPSGNVVRQKVEKWVREEITPETTLKSGDIVEVELDIETKNDYEYVMLSDTKGAGFEPVDVRSGYRRKGLHAYMELRDREVTFFLSSIPRGKHSLTYRLRAEIPGKFSALPTHAQAMYAPELEGNSDEMKLEIID